MVEYNVTSTTLEPKTGWPVVDRLLGGYTELETLNGQVVARCLVAIVSSLCAAHDCTSQSRWLILKISNTDPV